VRALVEPGADPRNLDGLDIERVTCDVTDARATREAVGGCDTVFHLAAIYKLWTPDPAPLWRVNVEGTTNVMLAAQAAGVRRVVHTSSIMAMGLAAEGPTDESVRFGSFDLAGVYSVTKHVSERVVMRFAEAGLPVVVVNPSMPFGPGDRAPTPTGRTLLTILEGRVPAVGHGNLSLIDVDDCARGHVLAADRGVVGERYILSAHDVSIRTFVESVCRLAGLRPPRVHAPRWVGTAVAIGLEKWSDWVSHEEPRLTVREARFTQRCPTFSNRKAVTDLGLRVRPLDETLQRAIDWFRAEGMAP
jgi:dihydroflavonol-4-reductase